MSSTDGDDRAKDQQRDADARQTREIGSYTPIDVAAPQVTCACMPITVHKHGEGRYQVAVSPPEGSYWRSSSPVTAREIFEKLPGLGCHITDISDALYAADPLWAAAYDKEVLTRLEAGADSRE